MRIRATVVKALAAGALLAGTIGVVGATSASAAALNTFYVSTHGTTNVNNTCTTKSAPCALISHAVAEAVAANPAGPNTIVVAGGKYSQAINLSGITNMTIVGKAPKNGKLKTVLSAANPVINVPAGNSGVTVENIAAVGSGGGANGIEVDAGNTVNTAAFSVSSGAPANAVSSTGGNVENVTVAGTLCTSTTKTDIPANAPNGTLVSLTKKIPKCAGNLAATPVKINGISETVDSAGRKALGLTVANGPTDIPQGSTVAYASTTDAYSVTGVVCTGCTVTGSSINGSGAAGTNGIQAETGGNDTITGNTVNGNANGIAVEVPGPGNTITVGTALSPNSGGSNGTGIAVDGQVGGTGTVNVTGNGVGGLLGGIALNCITTGAETVTGNTASSTGLEGAGLVLAGVQNVQLTGNTASGTLGVMVANGLLADCPTTASTGNTFTSNTVKNSLLLGVLIAGANDPVDVSAALYNFGLNPTQAANEPNAFNSNTWSSNGEANLVDFNAYQSSVAPACGGVGATTSIPAGTTITSVNVVSATTCTLNPGVNLEDANDGTPPGHINQELYVQSAVTLIAGVPGTVSVKNFLPLASSQFDAAPAAGLVAGDTLYTDQNPALNAPSTTTNTYNLNSAQPHFNGSSTLDAITGSGGYYSA